MIVPGRLAVGEVRPEAEAMGSKRQGARAFQVMNSGTTFKPGLRHNSGEGDNQLGMRKSK
jgi:hypothetical protein